MEQAARPAGASIRLPDRVACDEILDWLDDDFDPEAFDLEDVNRKLGNLE